MPSNNLHLIEEASRRISKYLSPTPVANFSALDKALGHNIYLKLDSEQVTGAFKIRAVLNHLLILQEKSILPKKIVGYTTGNHGLAMGYCASLFNIHARIYVPNYVSIFKAELIKQYPVELIYTNTRKEAEERALSDAEQGFYYLHPSNSEASIAGSGTMCYEALGQVGNIDAIFASCGGGGLLSGTYMASKLLSPSTLVYGSEPCNANDAYLSVKSGQIYKFKSSPSTIADGLKALSVSEKTYEYLKKLDDIILVDDDKINYWTKFCYETLNLLVEPSCAINLEAARIWSAQQNTKKRILVLISGKNYNYIG